MPSVLAYDMPGSSLTIAYTNYLQDSANRKLLVDSANRKQAIDTVVTWLGTDDPNKIGDGYAHPDSNTVALGGFDTPLVVNRITASAVGINRWIVTVEYIVSKFTGFPSTVSTLMNAKVSYEAVQVWCTTDSFSDGLPFGGEGTKFLHPGSSLNRDPKDPPQAWIFSRPVMSIQEPFSQTTNPLDQNALENTGRLLAATRIGGHNFAARTVRFDGADITSTVGNSLGAVTYSGVKTYSASPSGFYQQRLLWGEPGGTTEGWYCENELAFRIN